MKAKGERTTQHNITNIYTQLSEKLTIQAAFPPSILLQMLWTVGTDWLCVCDVSKIILCFMLFVFFIIYYVTKTVSKIFSRSMVSSKIFKFKSLTNHARKLPAGVRDGEGFFLESLQRKIQVTERGHSEIVGPRSPSCFRRIAGYLNEFTNYYVRSTYFDKFCQPLGVDIVHEGKKNPERETGRKKREKKKALITRGALRGGQRLFCGWKNHF